MVDEAEGNGCKKRGLIKSFIQSLADDDTTSARVPVGVDGVSTGESFEELPSGAGCSGKAVSIETNGRIG